MAQGLTVAFGKPAGAINALKWINDIMRPEVHASFTKKVFSASPNKESKQFVKSEIANNPTIAQ